jgi:hypothetical protein
MLLWSAKIPSEAPKSLSDANAFEISGIEDAETATAKPSSSRGAA